MKLQMMQDPSSPELNFLDKLSSPTANTPVDSIQLRDAMVYLCKALEVPTDCPGAELILFVKHNRRYFEQQLEGAPGVAALEHLDQMDFPPYPAKLTAQSGTVQWVLVILKQLNNMAVDYASTVKTSHF